MQTGTNANGQKPGMVVVDLIAYVVLTFCVGLAVSIAIGGAVLLLAGEATAAQALSAPPVAGETASSGVGGGALLLLALGGRLRCRLARRRVPATAAAEVALGVECAYPAPGVTAAPLAPARRRRRLALALSVAALLLAAGLWQFGPALHLVA